MGVAAGCSATKQAAAPSIDKGPLEVSSKIASEGPISWHVIEAGQTLWELAQRYGLPVEAVIQSNPDILVHAIPAGTPIRLPGLFDQARLIIDGEPPGWWPLAGMPEKFVRLASQEVRDIKPRATLSGRRVFPWRDGIVVLRGRLPVYGNILIIRHDQGDYGVYGGLKVLKVREGDLVRGGAPIAVTSNRPFYFALIPATDGPLARYKTQRQKQVTR